MKKQNGITLIALVITIIVLLILAGVSIAAITGENGIVDKAKEAAEKTETAQKEEEDILAGYEDAMDELLDEGFPYGTLYSFEISESAEMGLVVYSNGKAEAIVTATVDGTTIEGSMAVVDATVSGKVLTVVNEGSSFEYTIADDYSTITMGDDVYTKTSKTYTYCAHTWETTDEVEDSHKCSKCDMYGEHTYTANGSAHECECGFTEDHTYNASGSCDVCGDGCSHGVTTTETTDNGSGQHNVTTTCSDCGQQVSQTAEDHTLSEATYTDNEDGTHTSTQTCSECSGTVTSTADHVDSDSDNACDNCSATITAE